MKIERVSENQLKLTLTQADLEEREINLDDLINPSPRTQQLFRDIMEQALGDYDFLGENIPLMVEASPLGVDGIMIIITKMVSTSNDSDPYDFEMPSSDPFDWNAKGLEEDHIASTPDDAEIMIFAFATLDDIIHLALRLYPNYDYESSIYKENDRFFLALTAEPFYKNASLMDSLQSIIEEYGEKYVSNNLSISYLQEYGELLVEKKALPSLANAFIPA